MSRNAMYDSYIESTKDRFFATNFSDFNIDPTLNDFFKYESVSILYKMKAVYEAKDSDYSENDLPMGNLIESKELGIQPWKGVLLRIGDKKRRIGSFLNKESFKVKDEAVDDTLIDMANYSFLGCCLWSLDFNSEFYYEVHNAWLEMSYLCVIAKVLFNNDTDKSSWKVIIWPIILENYNKLANFALEH